MIRKMFGSRKRVILLALTMVLLISVINTSIAFANSGVHSFTVNPALTPGNTWYDTRTHDYDYLETCRIVYDWTPDSCDLQIGLIRTSDGAKVYNNIKFGIGKIDYTFYMPAGNWKVYIKNIDSSDTLPISSGQYYVNN